MNIGVISGHPLPGLLEEEQEVITVETKYGMVTLRVAKHSGHKIFFLNRHGEPPTNPPHKINYR
ncbi:MAG TPA: S-methyl-5'-thioadenosine phosphorylase, partial [Thermoplasmatales archaeon]|nr:S-methyl-5'-thioadenosine phosphorylase [Thermoplasmatales archaeon]